MKVFIIILLFFIDFNLVFADDSCDSECLILEKDLMELNLPAPILQIWVAGSYKESSCLLKAPFYSNMWHLKLMEACKSTIEILEALSGFSVYIKNPQVPTGNAFKIYNPDFVRWAANNIIPAGNNSVFKLLTQKTYEEKLKPFVRSFYLTYLELQRNKVLAKIIREEYTSSVIKHGYFDKYSDYAANNGYEFSTNSPYRKAGDFCRYFGAPTQLTFWMRREIGNTDKIFAAGLESLLSFYDPVFMQSVTDIRNSLDE